MDHPARAHYRVKQPAPRQVAREDYSLRCIAWRDLQRLERFHAKTSFRLAQLQLSCGTLDAIGHALLPMRSQKASHGPSRTPHTLYA